MFDQVVSWLENSADGVEAEFSDRDVKTAVAVLYYHMIAEDGIVRLKEIEKFSSALQSQFGIDDEQVHELMQRAVRKNAESPGLFPFTVILNQKLDEKKRREVMQQLTALANADGHRHPLEIELLAHIGKLLKV